MSRSHRRASGNCPDIEAFQVKGLDEGPLKSLYTSMQTSDGNTHDDAEHRRQERLKTSDGNYAYFKGDIVFTVDASSDEERGGVGLALLP